jgi:DmsE family decaheme c-type cytochrome
MKIFKKLLVISAVMGAIGLAPLAFAQNNLPELGQSKADIAKSAFKEDAKCTKCHDESENAPILSIYQTKHGVKGDARTPQCTSCHGQSEKHLAGAKDASGRPAPDFVFKKGVYEKSPSQDRMNRCETCHRGEKRANWNGSQHQVNDVACNDCHVVHNPVDKVRVKQTQTQVCYTCHKEQRADSLKNSTHPIAVGKVVCSDCHNPHGSTGPKLLKKNTLNETCFLCHAEKRGPLRFEHQPVVQDCSNCHTPHGSNISPLLKDRPPTLCEDCHDGAHQSKNPPGILPGGVQAGLSLSKLSSGQVGRACMNCHVMVHGSNSPAGGFFQR